MPRRASKFRKLGSSKLKTRGATEKLEYGTLSETPSRERGPKSKKRSRAAADDASNSRRTSRRSGTESGSSRVVPPYPITRCPADILDGLGAFDGPRADARKVHHMLHRIVESECSGIEKAFSGADEELSATLMAVAREFCAAVKERCDATDSGDGTLTQTNPRNVELRAQETDLAARIAQLQSELAEWERVEANLATSSTAAQQLLDEQIAAALAAGAEEALDAAAESSVAAPRASLARTAQEMVADVDALEGTVELAAKRTALIEDRSSEMEARLVSATAARQDATLPNVRAPKAAIRQMVAQPRT